MSEQPINAQTPNDEQELRVVIVDQSKDAHDEARDAADARLDKELGEGGGFKRFLNGIWKGNLARDYYRQKYIHENLATMHEENTVFTQSAAEHRTAALKSTIDRFSSDYEELIHTQAGEKKETKDETDQLSRGVKKIIEDFVEGRLDETTLREEKVRLFNEYRKEHGVEALGKGVVTADNLLSIAQTVAGVVEHGESLDSALGRLDVVTGEARNGARTEAQYNTTDKAIDWLAKRKLASFLTPGTLAVVVAGGMAVTRVAGQSVIGAATKTLLPGIAAGGWAALRENKRTKDDRAQHAREMAVGGQFDTQHDTRRIEMEKTRYDTRLAGELSEELARLVDEERLNDGGNDALQAALDALAAARARVRLSDEKGVDLISYSSKEAVGEERMLLDIAQREARSAVEARLTAEARAALNLGPQASVAGLIDQRALLFQRALIEGDEQVEGIEQKDAAFAKLKATRVAKAAAIGVATGIAGGIVAQEAVAAFDPTRFGLIDMIRGEAAVPLAETGQVHQTLIEGFIRGDETILHTDASTTYDSYPTAEGKGFIEVSDDHSLVANANGGYDLVAANGNTSVEGLTVDAEGTFDQASLDKLDEAGMVVEDTSYSETITTTSSAEVSTHQYINNHISETTHVTRDLWYGNDTPGVYDQNELRVYRGGSADAPGIIEGGYQYTVAGMTADGSYWGNESVDWNQAAANGNLFVAVSGTFDTQGNPFMIPIGPNGEVNIPADSPAGQFFANENNSVAFNGAYMEIVQATGQDAEGVVHIRPLATLVGSADVASITDTITTEEVVHHAEYTITTNGYDTVQANSTESAPITPIASRRSMEAMRKAPEHGYYYGNRELSAEDIRQRRKETSPRLLNDPSASLEVGQELDWYDKNLKNQSPEYAREIQQAIATSPELAVEKPDLRAIVTIPVGASAEADNIYKTLSLYAQQDPSALARSKFLLHVNWFDSDESDSSKAEAIAKTKAEIERARTDFPELTIATIETVWSREKEQRGEYGNGIIGHVARKLYDTAMLSVQQQIKNGVLSPNQDVVMIRNDADAQGMDRRYLARLIDTAEEHPENDVFTGAVRWETARYRDMPGLAFVANLQSTMQLAALRRNVQAWPQTVGINTTVRMSTFAAVGGIGEDAWDTGAGSDDLKIGGRISDARSGKISYRGGIFRRRRYYASTDSQRGSYSYHRLVAGAGIDSKADRIERAYLTNGVAYAWNNFNKGGYEDRSSGLERLPRKEDIIHDSATILKRIEDNVSGLIAENNPAQMNAALALMLPREVGGRLLYTITRSRFKLTDDGAKWLLNRLRRNGKGQFDAIGGRVRRQLYSEALGKLKPASPVPRFVS